MVDQLVLLGAGFDTRAHRLPAVRELTTFEVDHPATQARKVAIVAGEGLDARGVVYVPVDFERDRPATRAPRGRVRSVAAGGVRVGGRHELPHRGAVDATLAVVRELAAPGSALVFTYVHAGVLDGARPFPEAERWVHNVQQRRRAVDVRAAPEELTGVPPAARLRRS